jgi:hypothetical protein
MIDPVGYLRARMAEILEVPNSVNRFNYVLGIAGDALRRTDPKEVSLPDIPGKSDRPIIVCLCGSTKFKEAYEKASMEEGIAGRIVLSVACFPHTDGGRARELVYGDGGAKPALDGLHKRKIELADEIYVLNVGGYVGDSTRGEIAHARSLGKKIRWLEEPKPESMAEDASVSKEE